MIEQTTLAPLGVNQTSPLRISVRRKASGGWLSCVRQKPIGFLSTCVIGENTEREPLDIPSTLMPDWHVDLLAVSVSSGGTI